MSFPATRLRRLRRTPALRAMVRETHLAADHLVLPLFVRPGTGERRPIDSMPGCFQLASVYATLSPNLAGPNPGFSFNVPTLPSWAGVKFYLQAVLFDPGANPRGVVTSNAIESTIGRVN